MSELLPPAPPSCDAFLTSFFAGAAAVAPDTDGALDEAVDELILANVAGVAAFTAVLLLLAVAVDFFFSMTFFFSFAATAGGGEDES